MSDKRCFWKTCIWKTCFWRNLYLSKTSIWKTCFSRYLYLEKPVSERPVFDKNRFLQKPVCQINVFLKNLYLKNLFLEKPVPVKDQYLKDLFLKIPVSWKTCIWKTRIWQKQVSPKTCMSDKRVSEKPVSEKPVSGETCTCQRPGIWKTCFSRYLYLKNLYLNLLVVKACDSSAVYIQDCRSHPQPICGQFPNRSEMGHLKTSAPNLILCWLVVTFSIFWSDWSSRFGLFKVWSLFPSASFFFVMTCGGWHILRWCFPFGDSPYFILYLNVL